MSQINWKAVARTILLSMLAAIAARQAAVAGPPQAIILAQNPSGLTQTIEQQAPPLILLNGEEIPSSVPPMWEDRIAYVAVTDDIAGALGARIFTGKTAPLTVSLKTLQTRIEFTDGQTAYLLNGAPAELQAAPFHQSGFLMVPAVEFFQAFGFNVKVDLAVNAVRISRSVANTAVPQDLIDAVFAMPEVHPAPRATGTVPAKAHPEVPEQKAGKIEYTYDNTIGFENITVSGASDQSNLIGTSALSNQFNLRLQKQMGNGYKFTSTLRTSETTDPLFNKAQVEKLALAFEKGGIYLSLYDIIPKFTYYTLKNYQIRGVQYERKLKEFSWTALAGKSPKRLADSEYSRYIEGFRIHRAMIKDRDFGISFVRVRDTGGYRSTEKTDNKVFSLNNTTKYGKYTKLQMEYALSTDSVNSGKTLSATAGTAQAQYRQAQVLCTGIYEHTGSDFNSETTFFTSGRREFSGLCNKKLNQRTLVGMGMKSVLLGGERTRSIPLFYSVQPFQARKKLKLTTQKNFEKASSEFGTRITDVRSGGYSDEFGKLKFDANLERRKQKESDGVVSFRNSQRYRFDTFFSEKTEMNLQVKKELRTRGASPRTRFSQLRVDHELKAWNDLSLTTSRYYNGTSNNRTDFSAAFRKIDIENDTELDVEYRFYNYSAHNDNVVRFTYSFFK